LARSGPETLLGRIYSDNTKPMQYETIANVRLPKLGFGTWKIGGSHSPDPSQDNRALAALRSALELGYTHFDTAEMYAAGHTEELLGRAIKESGVARESLFITSKVNAEHLRYEAVLTACEGSLRRLGMEYLDLYLIHWPSPGMNLPESFRSLNELVVQGRVRHLGVSNFDVKLMKAAQALSETPLLTNQVPYSLTDRSNVENGVLAYCQASGIVLSAYTPLEKGHMRPTAALQGIAKAHSCTPQQIALAWLTKQERVVTIPMSHDPAHQRQNLQAVDIRLSDAELKKLN
jgi:diketogulonate reductase-like aldo/keto reductase